METHISWWRSEWIILQLQIDQGGHVPHLGGEFPDPIAANVQRHQLQVRQLPGNVDQLIVAQQKGAQLSQLHHPVGQACDLVAGCVHFGELVHPAQFVGQLQQTVVGDQQDLQWQQAYLSW